MYYLHEVKSAWVFSVVHIADWWDHEQPLSSYMQSIQIMVTAQSLEVLTDKHISLTAV